MTGFLRPLASRGTRRSCSRSRKRQTRRRRNPSSVVASCPALSPCACVPGASPITPAVSPVALTGRLRRRALHPGSARVPSVLPAPQAASLRLGHSWG
ncbi:unnamed protein product [Rangifer tarandus platyrhynchus]|uniref:Uncharacterized protein n=2 Tax=Rangifer tarandus platyrhynchus TaxID=3082113 RepID=A0ACB0DZ26_RANTA|nr:unnamed protein product [Rangifer tarandus platyrhynchus]CAI9693578.1 unnamed protein product [Rangifer tarandus platyrhynchus]